MGYRYSATSQSSSGAASVLSRRGEEKQPASKLSSAEGLPKPSTRARVYYGRIPKPPPNYVHVPDPGHSSLLPDSHDGPTALDFPFPDAPFLSANDVLQSDEQPIASAHMLVRRLRRFASSLPPPPLLDILHFHADYPDFHSVESYNIVLRVALRHVALNRARSLLSEMRDRGIGANVETWQLRTHLLVRSGRWPEAFHRILNYKDDWMGVRFAFSGQAVPVSVWSELVSRESLSHARRVRDADRPRLDPGVGMLERYHTVMSKRDEMLGEGEKPSGRSILNILEVLLRMGNHDAAKAFLSRFLSSFGPHFALRMVNVYIGLTPKSTTSFSTVLEDLNRFAAAYPALHPSAHTLFLLLGHLRRVVRCATTARSILKMFVHKWGDQVLDGPVCRRLLSLGLKEGRKDLVQYFTALGQRVVADREREQRPSDDRRGGMRAVYTHRGTERARWWRLMRKARQPRLGRSAQKPNLETSVWEESSSQP
ncbi:hypothetical protein K488DRAFT_84950 [Vararia minispora EC-137]|uniref:Uncharacterized protein n=1 Tax=Vararia minispora EC-137 TaxID=1314806 RepID=A0ACB8QNJ7_9AGAM|nr:hypothetical protein K488DRAFT_84950 [Vararia minispora EC-137]